MTDQAFMRRSIALARAQVGQTGANPSVGCVLVRDGIIVGEGVTGLRGRPHGEEAALAMAGDAAEGSTVYVTLEPCAQRSTGAVSCTDRLIAAGVRRVVVACQDPSVFADGEGARRLRAAGMRVDLGVLADEAADLYAEYLPAKPPESRR